MSIEIGMRLRQARERLGYSLAYVSRETNIELKYLIAIEKGQFEFLPNMIYARAYVKAYADLVGERVRFSSVTSQQTTRSRNVRSRPQSSPYQSTQQTSQQQQRYSDQLNRRQEQSQNQSYQSSRYDTQNIRPRSDLLDQEEYHRLITKQELSEIVSRTKRKNGFKQQVTGEEVEEHYDEEIEEDEVEDELEEEYEEDYEEEYEDEEEELEEEELEEEGLRRSRKKQPSRFAKIYNGILIFGGICLILAFCAFLYLKWTSVPGLPLH
ncbi:Helix-turn-helix domain-containing protein [Seinonella peptonophila]|uniref:Helix-turn-helix domain-containing protein n=1 Tax=Seinonella peptonophila TaxID=112248 RepID=A0A1M4TB46_9BACL|nr:helix-turn-helix domain-containing protein [Seinonella peptonophila]SHE41650.1 Helix-turn-helix domain-containing protein [Seinonella peptonophila]